jgi:hypothetical protein
MTEFPVDAKVECSDGTCGKSAATIINPINATMTHLVVEEHHGIQRLVPVDQVLDTSHHQIRLACSKAELATMEPFVETHYLRSQRLDRSYPAYMATWVTADPPMEGYDVPVEEERIPPGELAIRRGANVHATDGLVGKVEEFVVDRDSHHITHLVLEKGHLWGKKEIAVPISAIDDTFENTVYLKLDKRSVEALPPLTITRHYD